MSTIDSKPNHKISRVRNPSARRNVSQTYWAQEQDSCSSIPLAARMQLLHEHGNFSLAFSTAVQPRLQHFGDDTGYIAFRKRWGMTFALGEVVAPASRQAQLLDDFIRSERRVSFCQISQPLAAELSKRGFYVNEMGIDSTLDLDSYTLAGKQKEWLRYAANWVANRGYRIVESSFAAVTADAVETVSEAWRKTRTVKRKEVRFLNRPIVMEDERDVRKFFLFSAEQKLLAFVFLDPIYESGEIIGYVTAFKRRHPEAPQYAEQAIMKHVIERLKQEGVARLKLGLSPLANISDEEFKHNKRTHWFFQKAYSTRWINRHFYNVVGHAEYKKRFRGHEEKVYFASPSRFNSPRLLALIGLCGIA